MANASSDGAVDSRPADASSSLGTAMLIRAGVFILGTFALAFLVTVTMGDDGMSGVLVGILLSLSGLAFVGTVVAAVLAAVRSYRRG
ncbi:hypothetical protein [Halomarina litorea]|uniref:hypothetical protein n=1 Tax=Halomarina litorea TaxID=2961595 RepID=UPI0020C37524|nr:hypothetical protein [Halomarina sp. BCD28]